MFQILDVRHKLQNKHFLLIPRLVCDLKNRHENLDKHIYLILNDFGRENQCFVLQFVLQFIFFPQWVSKLSFQLSYAATLGIILFAKKEIIRPHSLHGKISQAIRQDLRISLSAQVFTAPLIFFHFKEISLIAPVSNLLVSFMVAPIMFIGLLTVIFGKISYVLGVVPSYLAYGMLKYMMIVIELLSRLPFAFIHV